MVLMPYLSYMLSELLELSGILSVFFCGIVMSHYTWHNVTKSSRITTRHMFATLSFIAEAFIFLYVGMDALDIDKWKLMNVSLATSIAISGVILVALALGRAAFVFPLSTLSNLMRRSSSTRISVRHQIIIWWAGLMRGAVSIALAYNQFASSGTTRSPANAAVITSTIIVVLLSTMVFGMLTKPLVECRLPHHMRLANSSGASTPKDIFDDENRINASLLQDGSSNQLSLRAQSSSLQMLLHSPTSTVHYFWRKFDDAYMRPLFGGRHIGRALEEREEGESDIA